MERCWILGTVRYGRYTILFEITGILPVLPSIFQLPEYRYGTVISSNTGNSVENHTGNTGITVITGNIRYDIYDIYGTVWNFTPLFRPLNGNNSRTNRDMKRLKCSLDRG